MIDPKLKQNYVFEGTEVKLTGRTAKKPSTLTPGGTIILYEVSPADDETIQWKKWVKEADLFIIEE